MKKLASLVLFLGLSLVAMAQGVTFKGRVLDSSNQPIVGAFIVEQGTSNGAMTDVDGAFSLRVTRGAVVEVSCLGYESMQFTINNDQTLDVVLKDDSQMLGRPSSSATVSRKNRW